jgi:hypothetical protein
MSGKLPMIPLEKNDAISRIKKFLGTEQSGITLSANEEKIMTRLWFAITHLKEKKLSEDHIAEKIKAQFDCSIYTARKDIANAYNVYVHVSQSYKQFGIKTHIEFLEKLIRKYDADKSLAPLVPKIAHEITLAYDKLPTEAPNSDVPAPVIIVNIVTKENAEQIDALRKEADDLIEHEKKHEYIDYEEADDDDE